MIASLTATVAALAIGLPIFVLGEYLRDRRERRYGPHTSPTRKDTP